MNRVKVKICGLTRATDVRAAAGAGADMLGFVFADSPRRLDIETAARLVGEVPRGVLCVGVFLDQPAKLVDDVLARVPLGLLQFHGRESNTFCAAFGMPFVKAVAMGGSGAESDPHDAYPDAEGLLYDSHAPGAPGGQGRVFDWSLLPRDGRRLWLAGGLTVDNVAEAVERCHPWAVDVSSGVEDSPGVKNHDLVRRFVDSAKSVEW
jgi:phosphoribosylanthranilate isomerase